MPVFHVSIHGTIESLCGESREPAAPSSLFRLCAWGSKVGVYAPRELTIAAIVLAPGLSFVLPGVLNGATLITGPGILWRAALSRIIGSSPRCRTGLPWTVEIYGPFIPVSGSLPLTPPSRAESIVLDGKYSLLNCVSTGNITFISINQFVAPAICRQFGGKGSMRVGNLNLAETDTLERTTGECEHSEKRGNNQGQPFNGIKENQKNGTAVVLSGGNDAHGFPV